MRPNQSSFGKFLGKLLFFAVLISLPVIFWLNHQKIYDWWRLRNYTPSAEVQTLATNTTMNDATRKVFYINHPAIEDGQQLSSDCRESERTIVLGCYINGKGIFIYNVSDARLNGVKEVTSAHETLHAEYDRLSPDERTSVDQMTQAAYAQVTDQRIKDTVEQYRKQDPSVVPNELHSILGTEVRNLPPELENYYRRYFDDRSKIVAYSEGYESEFSSRQAKVSAYDAQLATMKKQIDDNQQSLATQSEAIKQERARLNQLKQSGNFEAYNSGVDAFNRQVSAYNALADQTSQLITNYNNLVAQRNAVAVEVNDLAKAIDSRPQGISSQ